LKLKRGWTKALALVVITLMVSIGAGWITTGAVLNQSEETKTDTVVALVARQSEDHILVYVSVTRIDNFDAGQFDITYDPAKLSFVKVENGEITGAIVPVDNWAEINDGRLRVIVNAPGIKRFSGYGHLALVVFAPVEGATEKARVQIDKGYLNDHEGKEIAAQWSSTSVKLASSSGTATAWIWPQLGTLLGIGAFLALIASIKWFRNNIEIDWR